MKNNREMVDGLKIFQALLFVFMLGYLFGKWMFSDQFNLADETPLLLVQCLALGNLLTVSKEVEK